MDAPASQESLDRPPGHRRPFVIAAAAALLLLGGAAIFLWNRGIEPPTATGDAPGSSPGTGGAPPAKDAPAAKPTEGAAADQPEDVQVIRPTRRDILYSLTLPANVSPLYQTTLYAKVSGYLKWIGPDKGDLVKKDQVLAVIDAPEVQEQYEQAQSDYKIKKLTYERLAKVWQESPDVIAKQDVDVAEAAYESAKNAMEQRRVMREYTKVRAPYDGVITARFADPGALIQVATASATGAIPLFTIMDVRTVRVYTNVPQSDAPLVQPGTPAILTVKEYPNRSFKGAVTRTTRSLDPATRTLLVEIDMANDDLALQPGTFGEVMLHLRQSQNALVIPPGAIVTNGKAKSVFVVDQGKAKQVAVRTSLTDGRWVEVVHGLAGTEDVIVVGNRTLADGTAVRPSPYDLPEGTPAAQKFEAPKIRKFEVPKP